MHIKLHKISQYFRGLGKLKSLLRLKHGLELYFESDFSLKPFVYHLKNRFENTFIANS